MSGLASQNKQEVAFNILTVVNEQNSPRPIEVYTFVKRQGDGHIPFIPAVERCPVDTDENLGLHLAIPPFTGDVNGKLRITSWTVSPERLAELYINISDERDEAGVDDGWGIAPTLLQRFGPFTLSVRYGFADVNADGPTAAKHMVNVGMVTGRIFGQSNDRVELGFSWADPADSDLDDQSAIDAYYLVQVTPEIQLGPTLEVDINPIRNPDEGTVAAYGF